MFTRSLSICLISTLLGAPPALGSEGWMVEPTLHGDTVVFASEGDLWVADLGGESADSIPAHRLTSGPGQESRPIFSPDGTQVAFSAEYDGNQDVYLMPVAGGVPTRLTFHPAADSPMGFSPDGRFVTFHSTRAHPLGKPEGYRVHVGGGLPEPLGFGACMQLDHSSTGRQVAFVPYSNDGWNWRNYRGGTAPNIWIGVPEARDFRALTTDDANDLFPMWTGGRITFLSDRSGAPNLHTIRPDGSELTAVTNFASNPDAPTAVEGYELRSPSRDRARGGTRVVFSQGGRLGLVDPEDGTVSRPAMHLVSDRARTRVRTEDGLSALDAFSLSPDGDRLMLESRGELLLVPVLDVTEDSVRTGSARQLTESPAVRERHAAWVDDDTVVMITDANGEQQIGRLLVDEPGSPFLLTDDRSDWIIEVRTSPEGRWVGFSDRTGRLHIMNLETLELREVTRSKAGEIVDFEFSPNGEWLVIAVPQANGFSGLELHSTRTMRTIPLSDGLTSDHAPRFGPEGRTLFFLSDRNADPTLGTRDFEHVFLRPTQVFAAPLVKGGVPPLPEAIELVDDRGDDASASPEEPADGEMAFEAAEPQRMRVDPEGLLGRAVRLPIPSGSYEMLETIPGGLLLVDRPVTGLLEEVWPEPLLGAEDGELLHYDLATATLQSVANGVADVSVARDAPRAIVYGEDGFSLVNLEFAGEPPVPVDLPEVPMLIDVATEWRHIFDEAWRLQRDFYWAPNMGGVDWDAMRTKYAAVLPRVGTRAELSAVIGEMLAELGTSHTYIWGGDDRNQADGVDVGLLGADLVSGRGGIRIRNRLGAPGWSGLADGPVAPDWVGVPEDAVLRSIDGRAVNPGDNPYALLQGKADGVIKLGIASEPGGPVRQVRVRPISSERQLRYANWVEGNRRRVDEATEGRVGYLHLPDMDGEGLSMFGRLFYPQVKKDAMLVDVRDNGGGFVSQMVISRLARRPWAYGKPRHGAAETYPWRVLDGPMAVLIDEHAGSDGDIFPESFRLLELGPLIGTRTWGGVIGIRADKPSVDGGITTQPEYAWWEPKRGWSLENSGVAPDIEVPITPADRMENRDPQLDRGIRELLETLDKNPPVRPEAPPYPDR